MLSLAVLGCHMIVIHYSRVSRDSIIAASAFFSNRDNIANAINCSALPPPVFCPNHAQLTKSTVNSDKIIKMIIHTSLGLASYQNL